MTRDHSTGDQRRAAGPDRSIAQTAGIHAMSVDVEDYFQVWALSSVIDRDTWDSYSLRVEDTTRRVLDLFARTGTTATFFTLGWVAERCPALMRDIVDAGHEVGSHGYEHIKVFDQTPDQFRTDVVKTKTILEDVTGKPVNGYRAAGFSIDDRTPWAFEILAAAGHLYSSSVHPIMHDHYGMPEAPRQAWHPVDGAGFVEIPVSTVDAWGRRFSCAGGGWFRLLPYAWSHHLLTRLIEGEGGAAVFYFHPWEIDPGQPRIDGISARSRLRHYTNLDRMEAKLEKLLTRYPWRRMDEVFPVQPVQVAA
ncbi:DUF3473 domain-containing protein [Aquisalinus flavus]|nr:XrtA system polysaccharide deacetylase [Aquisalinus flavus]MBD0427190.1 DUF3473 domain-containing protein [Aquisalinus flavus]UNE49196.1 DUF3473 domain-containing protein [Aquisalinus flavus]